MNTDLKQYIGYWINRLRTCLHLAFEQRLAKYDLTVPQWCALLSIYGQHATTISTLSLYIEVDKASVSRVVERLTLRGLVNHVRGKDKRTGHLELTKQGKQLVPQLLDEAEGNENFFFGDLSQKEIDQLKNLLRKVLIKDLSISLDGWLKNPKSLP